LLDPTLVLSQIIALAVVFLPVEVYIVLQVRPIRRKADAILEPGEARSKLIDEVATAVLKPVTNPELREEIVKDVVVRVWEPISTPENRQRLISELGHGLVRVLKENEGSLRGIAARQAKSEILELAKTGAPGALGLLPGKVKLPIVGEVTIAEAMQIAAGVRELISKGGSGGLQGLLSSATSQGSTETGLQLPP